MTFAAFSQKGSAVYVVDEDGTGLRQITPSGLGARSAQWSPDGGLIAFSTPFANPQHPQVWVVRPDGRGLREVTYPASGTSSFAPIWSPDSSKLLFQRQQRAGRAVWTVNSDGKGLTKLADIPSDSESLYEWGTAPPS